MALLQNKLTTFMIEDILRDTHNNITTTADTPAVITTGYPRYCFPPTFSTTASEDWRENDCQDFSDQDKYVRPSFTPQQVKLLAFVFSCKPYLSGSERRELADDLNMTEKQVKNWFQNKRTKLKKRLGLKPRLLSPKDGRWPRLTTSIAVQRRALFRMASGNVDCMN